MSSAKIYASTAESMEAGAKRLPAGSGGYSILLKGASRLRERAADNEKDPRQKLKHLGQAAINAAAAGMTGRSEQISKKMGTIGEAIRDSEGAHLDGDVLTVDIILSHAKRPTDPMEMSVSERYMTVGDGHFDDMEYNMAISYYRKAIEAAKWEDGTEELAAGCKQRIVDAYGKMGHEYFEDKQIENAASAFMQARIHAKNFGLNRDARMYAEMRVEVYGEAGHYALDNDQFARAKEWYTKACVAAAETGLKELADHYMTELKRILQG